MMTAVRWTNDVSSADTYDATGPPALPVGTSTAKEGLDRRERVVVVVGSITASISRRKSDETLKQRADEPTNPIFMETKAKDEASSPFRIEGGTGEGRASTRAVPGLGELRRPSTRLVIRDTTPMMTSYDDAGSMDEQRVLDRYRRHDGLAGAARGHVDGGGAAGRGSWLTWEATGMRKASKL